MAKAKPKAAALLSLAPRYVSQDTVEALEALLARARAGEVTGVALAARELGSSYVVDLAGTCRRDLTFTRGMVRLLDEELAALLSPPA